MTPPPDEDGIRALFQEISAPPGVARWRRLRPVEEPEAVYIPPSHRERVPPRRRRTGLAVAASAFAVAVLVGVAPVVINALARHGAPPASGTGRPSASASAAPSPSGSPSAGASAPADQAPAPGGTGASPTALPSRWPDAKNTGVPAGKTLRTHAGDLVVTDAGTVVDGLLVNGSIIVQAPNVTVRNTRVTPGHGAYWAVRQTPGATNFQLENSEIAGSGVHLGVSMEAAGMTLQLCDIHDVDMAVSVSADNAAVRFNYLHAVGTGVGTGGRRSTLVIQHNTIASTIPGEAAIAFADNNTLTGVDIEDNRLGGGNYAFYAGGGSPQQQITVQHNRFTRTVSPKGGKYGAVANWNSAAPGNVWQDNVWDDTGTPVPH
jgi:hypothetical protein